MSAGGSRRARNAVAIVTGNWKGASWDYNEIAVGEQSSICGPSMSPAPASAAFVFAELEENMLVFQRMDYILIFAAFAAIAFITSRLVVHHP
jgi:hypothetical protein